MKTIKMTEEMYKDLAEEYCGVCLACGEIAECGIEPDAEYYECECCGKNKVFGMEQLIVMGRIDFVSEEEMENVVENERNC
jgi:hypothetical protein